MSRAARHPAHATISPGRLQGTKDLSSRSRVGAAFPPAGNQEVPPLQARRARPAFAATAWDDLDRLARGTGGTVTAHWGGHTPEVPDEVLLI